MADLYNLMDHIDDQFDDDDELKERRLTAATEATEESEDWESADNIEEPVVLKEAREKLVEDDFYEVVDEEVLLDENERIVKNDISGRLHLFWSQERNCPELLEYDEELVEEIKQEIEDRQDMIDELEGKATEAVDILMVNLAQQDLDRVKFVLSDWLRTRLDKIEAHPLHMRKKIDFMSDAELEYLKEYGALYESHLRETVLDFIPEAWQALDEENMIDTPDYSAYHFWLIEESFEYKGKQEEEGSCLVARFEDMRDFMRSGKLQLQL